METFLQFMRNLGTARIIMIGVGAAISVLFFGLIIGQLQTSPMTVLYSDIEPSDGAQIATRLESEGIPYETSGGGRIISVPRDQVDRLRLVLAGDGLSGGVVGKEIFDQEGSFGRTSFELNVNFVRAVEGELSRTIKYLQSVAEARVHIVMPERRPLMRNAPQPSASIMLRTRGSVGRPQVEAIQSLVASAVPGLSPERVTITDTSGRLLSDGAEDRDLANFSNLEEARLAKERLFRDKIESLISSRVGNGRVRAEVSLDIDMSRTTLSQTSFDPDNQVVLSQTLSEEENSEIDSVGGNVTVGNNLPTAAPPQNAEGSRSSRSEEVTNFENSKTESVTVREPGQIRQLRVAVLIDGIREFDETGLTTSYSDRTEDEIEQFRELVLTAIPFDEDRGDAITVQSMRFADPAPLAEQEQVFNLFGFNKQDVFQLLQVSGLILVAVLVLLTVVRPLVARIVEAIPEAAPPMEPAQIEPQGEHTPAIAGPGGVSAEVMERAAAGDTEAQALVRAARESGALSTERLATDSRIDMAQVEGQIQDSAVKKVSEIVRSSPDDSVAIVRSWLYAE